jgi:hypothetical protein
MYSTLLPAALVQVRRGIRLGREPWPAATNAGYSGVLEGLRTAAVDTTVCTLGTLCTTSYIP